MFDILQRPAMTRRHPPTRRDFIKGAGAAGVGLVVGPTLAQWLDGRANAAEMARSQAVVGGKARHITILHTSDIHAQLEPHDELFMEGGKPVFARRGGFATLRTMLDALRRQNPGNTLVVDGGDCLQGSAVAAFSQGRAIVQLMNALAYDVVLPGNWEVVYGKQMLIENLRAYSAAAVCANMFHADVPGASPIFSPYRVFDLSGIKVGFVGYNDPHTATRQAPAYSRGIRFTHPEDDLAGYVTRLREQEGCQLVFVLSHMGLAQQIHLSNLPCARGVDYILGADTHERVREPLQGAFTKVTEPGAFGSFIGKLDVVVEHGQIEDETYALLDVDPAQYEEDAEMRAMVAAARAPYRQELDRIVGTTTTPLLRDYVIETPMDNLITDALTWKFQTDIAVSNGFRFGPPLAPPPGGEAPITKEYLWSMLPVDTTLKTGAVTGRQIHEWLERELENAFSKDATKRVGGRLVRFKGLVVTFTIGNQAGNRVQDVKVHGQPLDPARTYTIVGCERVGDPDDAICRFQGVADVHPHDAAVHQVVTEYLQTHSPVAPVVEGRAVATDAPWDLVSQVEGTSYRFR